MKSMVISVALLLLLTGCVYLDTLAELPDVYTVVIDPGHGGMDGGASTADGVKESGINLVIAQRLDNLLGFLGINTILTRQEDTHLGGSDFKKTTDIKARLKAVEDNCGDVLLSIHQNHFSDIGYGGAQVFYGAAEDSAVLAGNIQNNLMTALDRNNRRTIKDGSEISYLMKNAECTAVLVECGFLSNPKDAENLQKEDYQKLTAMALAAGLAEFKGENKNES